jgi:hypothetical protein
MNVNTSLVGTTLLITVVVMLLISIRNVIKVFCNRGEYLTEVKLFPVQVHCRHKPLILTHHNKFEVLLMKLTNAQLVSTELKG